MQTDAGQLLQPSQVQGCLEYVGMIRLLCKSMLKQSGMLLVGQGLRLMSQVIHFDRIAALCIKHVSLH